MRPIQYGDSEPTIYTMIQVSPVWLGVGNQISPDFFTDFGCPVLRSSVSSKCRLKLAFLTESHFLSDAFSKLRRIPNVRFGKPNTIVLSSLDRLVLFGLRNFSLV